MNMITITDNEGSLKKVISKRHRQAKQLKLAMECTVSGIIVGLTPYMFMLADQRRGYDGIGGEVFFPFLALVAVGIIETVVDGAVAKQDVKDAGLWQ